MARFRFSLERLLAVRRLKEELAHAAVAEATADVSHRAGLLEGAEHTLQLAQAALRNHAEPPVKAAELQGAAQYAGRAGRDRSQARAALAQAQEVRSEKARAARAAWQAREMLSNLRSRRFAESLREEEKAAQNAVDDLVASRWERRSRW